MLIGGLKGGSYDTVQLADDESVQEDGINIPPMLPSFQETIPVGVVGEPEVSITVTVNFSCDC